MSTKKSKRIIKDASTLGQFSSAIAQICEEKGIEKDRVIESVEMALAAAYKKDYGRKGQLIVAKLDEKTGEVEFKQLKRVVDESVRQIENDDKNQPEEDLPKNAKKSQEERENVSDQEKSELEENVKPKFNPERDILLKEARKIDKTIEVGDFIEIPLETKDSYGRVASQTAKQVIIQKIREAERDAMYDEYKNKEGEVVNGVVQRIEGRNVYIDLGKAVGVLFPSEQVPNDNYRIGQRLKVYIEKVESDPKGPGITLSRRSPNLLLKIFELEVPEIFSKTVEIKAVAREAGNRSKIAVISNEEGIDPIGSCVGQKGTRVQAIMDEINGEKIDIIEWNDDVEKMIASALSPAKVVKVDIKESKKEAIAYVAEDQLSLAIGKRGQNVRLAAKLTGWKIDVVPLEKEEKESSASKEDQEKKQDQETSQAKLGKSEDNLKEEVVEKEEAEIEKKESQEDDLTAKAKEEASNQENQETKAKS